MLIKYQSYSHSVGNNLKHIVICTKYRWKIFKTLQLKREVEKAIKKVCSNHSIDLKLINVQSDHVHMIVDCPRTLSDAKLLQLIKGGSSYLLFRAVRDLNQIYPNRHLWSRGYFCANIGSDYAKVLNYIKNQDKHHKK